MKIKAVLFDLDGTLLPMDQDEFVNTYLGSFLAELSTAYGYDKAMLGKSIWSAMGLMINNDGSKTNEEVFWDYFKKIYGAETEIMYPRFEKFYIESFDNVSSVASPNSLANEAVKAVKKKGLIAALATNPVFPTIATEKRAAWAGLDINDFALYTTYENSSHCKPHFSYYEEVMAKLGVAPEECLMVGNDVGEDMITEKLGMKVFLLTDYVINKKGEDIQRYPHGSFLELLKFIEEINAQN